jgi:hypothetical protein
MPSQEEAMAEAADLAAAEEAEDFAVVEVVVDFAVGVADSAVAEAAACFGVAVADSAVADLVGAFAEDSGADALAGSDVAFAAEIDSFLASALATRRGIGPVTLIMDTRPIMGIPMDPTATTRMPTADTDHTGHMLLIRPLLQSTAV